MLTHKCLLDSRNESFDIRLEFVKYKFKLLFNHESDAAHYWNDGQQLLVVRLSHFLRYPENIIRRLYDENNMKVTDKVKSNMKLKTITLDEVNSNFRFATRHTQSVVKECDLVKKIINSYFGTVITLDKTKDDKYVKETISKRQYLKLNTDMDFLRNINYLSEKLITN